jgi:hypothetical protein
MPLHRSTEMYLVTSGDTLLDSLGVFPALEQLSYRDGSERHTAIPLFPADTRAFLGRNHLLIGDMDADSVLLYELGSRQRIRVKVPFARQEISPDALRYAKATACDWTSSLDSRDRCERSLLRLPTQTHYPLFRDLAIDSLGAIWLAAYSPDPALPVTYWHIIDRGGRLLGTPALPANLRLTQIGETYAVGISRDSLGVERVHEFRISRSGRVTR